MTDLLTELVAAGRRPYLYEPNAKPSEMDQTLACFGVRRTCETLDRALNVVAISALGHFATPGVR